MQVRLSKALRRCAALRPIWGSRSLSRRVAARVLRSCVFSTLLYGLHTMYFTTGWEKRLDAMQIRCLRRALGIQTTYASKLLGTTAITNVEVAEKVGAKPLSAEVQKMRYRLLGHVLRRGGDDPARASTYVRLAQPRLLAGTGRWGACRLNWAEEVIKAAACDFGVHAAGADASTARGRPYFRLAVMAQGRTGWASTIEAWYASRRWGEYGPRSSL